MTLALSGTEVAGKLEEQFPGSIVESDESCLVVKADSLLAVAAFLRDSPEYAFDYLNYVTAVDYYDRFEVVYQLTSLQNNHSLVFKAVCHDRQDPELPSVTGLWQGADFQEREIYDLMGISFAGHPNMKRIFLWDGFAGHPLRKDYM